MNGLAVLVLRYTHPGEREFQRPLICTYRGVQIPDRLGSDYADAVPDRDREPVYQAGRHRWRAALFPSCCTSYSPFQRNGSQSAAAPHVEMDQFNLELEGELTPEAVGARPGNILVPVSNISISIISAMCWTG